MIYWHIQMNQPWGRNKGKIDSTLMLKEKKPVIGTGDWDDFQCRNFKGEGSDSLKVNDIILVREGANPIALCKVKSDCFSDFKLNSKYHHNYYRSVEVISYYNGNEVFPQPQSTLQRLYNPKTDSWKFIDKFYKKNMKNEDNNKIKSLLKHKKQIILQGPPGTGKTRKAKLIAKEILGLDSLEDLKENTQFKLIQFHPSYTYEDFVRGIVAESKGDRVEYKNVNKILADFAEKALKNKSDSEKDVSQLSKEIWVDEQFEKFVDYINDEIEEKEEIKLTKSVFIINIDQDAFRYKGKKGWSENGNRMLFNDIKTAYLDENVVRQDIKKNKNLSGLAYHHASYYIRVLDMFIDFLKTEKLNFTPNEVIEKELKNYVLVIDEINRANLSSVLGELIYALEYRGEAVESMYAVDADNQLILPPNLYIIGTMNTADRSLGHIDYAIRRRFAFVDVLPINLKEKQELENFNESLFLAIEKLFKEHTSPEFEVNDVQLGHSYFIDKSNEENGVGMDIRFEYEIKPILLEYIKDGVLTGTDIKKKVEDLKILI